MFLAESNNYVIKYSLEKYETHDSCAFGMMRENRIEGLVTMGMTEEKTSGCRTYLFAVSELSPLSDVLADCSEAFEVLHSFVTQVCDVLDSLEIYMIPKSELILSSDLCFAELLEDGTFKVKLLCVPSSHAGGLSKGLRELFMYAFSRAAYKNDSEKLRAMELLSYIASEEFSPESLKQRLQGLLSENSESRFSAVPAAREKRISFLKRLKNAFEPHGDDFEDDIFDFEETTLQKREKLCVVAVRSSGDEYPIFGTLAVGTNADTCGIWFAGDKHPGIKPEHCKITMLSDRCFIENTHAEHETFINGKRLGAKERYELRPADVIKIGDEELIFSHR